ncbi:hypothetical protein [Tautonia marina]|uniref:hypothetical protein n=1 Tax=Tautonia marina TaxID=2653855 RepID=UPI0012604C67|nr:hypothetical protein [Tautonia marina]
MTRLVRLLGALLALAVMIAPVIGLALASIFAVEPADDLRATVVHWGLTLSDPFARDCLGHSLAITVVVVALATLTGITLARIAWGCRGWRRAIPLTLIRLGAGCHPFVMAMAWMMVLSRLDPSIRSFPRWEWLDGDRGRWLLLGLAQFGFASAWIAWWTGRALDRIGPQWQRVASISGAGRGWVWRTSIWPLVRPTVARVSASVFAVLLIEPGAPLVLGLRQTLGAQIVGSLWMTSRNDAPRAAILTALALVLSLLVRLALKRWGGPDHLASLPRSSSDPAEPIVPWGRFRSFAAVVALIGWAAITLGPAVALAIECFRSPQVLAGSATAAQAIWRELAPLLGGALALGGASTFLAMTLAWPLSAFRRTGSAVSLLNAVPPLAIGVGLLGIWQMARSWTSTGADPVGAVLPTLGLWLDPYRFPWLLVSWGTALVLLPWAVEAARSARSLDATALQEEARVAGRRLAFSRTLLFLPIALRRCVVPALGMVLLAASGLSPALVLTPLEPFRPVAAWVVRDAIHEPIAGPAMLLTLVGPMLGGLLLLRRDRAPESLTILRS